MVLKFFILLILKIIFLEKKFIFFDIFKIIYVKILSYIEKSLIDFLKFFNDL